MADDEKSGRPPQDEKSEKSKAERLLTKIKEHILLLAGVVAALSTLVGEIISLIKPFTPETKPAPKSDAVQPGGGTAVTAEKCFSARHLRSNQIPHYLLPSMGSSENFPYWLKFVGGNNCNKNLMLKVHFEPEAGVVLNAGDSASLVIDPQKKFSLTVAPDDIRLTSDEVKQVKISYTVKDEQGTAIDVGQISAKVVEPYTVAWDLQRLGKTDDATEPVDRAYLLKSLAAWVFRPTESIALRARECRTAPDGGPKLIKEAALQSCYENLFRGVSMMRLSNCRLSRSRKFCRLRLRFRKNQPTHWKQLCCSPQSWNGNAATALILILFCWRRRKERPAAWKKAFILLSGKRAARGRGSIWERPIREVLRKTLLPGRSTRFLLLKLLLIWRAKVSSAIVMTELLLLISKKLKMMGKYTRCRNDFSKCINWHDAGVA